MQGVLFKYGPGSAHVAFKSASAAKHSRLSSHQLHLVLVGGLTDGLLFAPYCQKLAAAAGDMGWTLVQAQLTSSYQGWGLASLDQDAAELRLLASCLAEQHDCAAWVLMGHSTGCQDAVRYVTRYRAVDDKLAGVILQAPVSDRECLSMYPCWADLVPTAQDMVAAGKGEEVLCRAHDFDGGAVTARRFLSLYCPGGDDDMFSTDLSLEQLQVILGPLQGLPCAIIQSGSDEAVPQALRDNGSMSQLGQRMVQAVKMGPTTGHTASAGSAGAGTVENDAGAATVAGSVAAAADSSSQSTKAGGTGGGCVGAGGSAAGGTGCATTVLGPQLRVVEGAGHACAGHEDELVGVVCEFLQGLPVGTS